MRWIEPRLNAGNALDALRAGDNVTFIGMLRATRSRWWMPVVGVLAGLAAAGVLAWSTTHLYASTTRLFVSVASPTDPSAAYQGQLFSQQRVTSYAELLTGQQLAGSVVTDLGLSMSPAQVAREVTATPVPDTVLLDVTVTDPSAARARDIAASLSRQFTRYVSELERGPTDAPSVTVTTVQPAQLNPGPVSPDLVRYLSIGATLGLVVGIALAVARGRLTSVVSTSAEVYEATGADVVGIVREDRQLARRHVITDLDPGSVSAENFRAIRTSLLFSTESAPPRVLVVASAVPGDGRTTVAVNLAIVLAMAGRRVLLIDADLRRPQMARRLGLSGGTGLTNVLDGTADLDDVVQPWGEHKLEVLDAGPSVADPSEMLGSPQMRLLLAALRHTHDHVIIDTPALLPFTDAAVVGALSDGCLLTARFARTPRDRLAEAAASLSRTNPELVGVVLTRVPRRAAVPGRYRGGRGDRIEPDRGTAVSRISEAGDDIPGRHSLGGEAAQ